MGRDKALLETNGSSVSLMLANRYAESLGRVIFSVDKKGHFPNGGFQEFVDVYPCKGPFNGLYSAFTQSDENLVFMTATDMPNGDPSLVRYLERMMGSEYDACSIKRLNGFVEPLFALYRRSCLELSKECLENGKLSLLEIYNKMNILEVPEEELTEWNIEKVLYNINTPQDYARYMSENNIRTLPVEVEPDAAMYMLLNLPICTSAKEFMLKDCLEMVLAEDIPVRVPIPPFNRSRFDGYSLQGTDTIFATVNNPAVLEVIEEIPAGTVPLKTIVSGTAARIMTGAPIPEGADSVVKLEDAEYSDKLVNIFSPINSGKNIILADEDMAVGQLLAKAGTRINLYLFSKLAEQGIPSIKAYCKPVVTVISTGSELVEVGKPLEKAKIYNNSSYFLQAFLMSQGLIPVNGGIVEDKPEKIASCISNALSDSDIVVTTGGTSFGDYDCILEASKLLGAETLFWKIRIKPGGAMLAATIDNKLILGLSGNPGAAAVGLLRVAMPYIRKLCGRDDLFFETVQVRLGEPILKESHEMRLIQGKLEIKEGEAWFINENSQSNRKLYSLISYDLLGEIPAGSPALPKGTIIKAYRL